MCAQFHWYLNKTGLRGLTGEKGDQGFSPIIEVAEDTLESYKLRITTENDEIETPNLKGSLSIQDQGGTYVRYDRESGELTANEADRATKESYGVVRLSKEEDLDVEELQDTVAMSVDVTKKLVNDSISTERQERTEQINELTTNLNDEKRYRYEQDKILQTNITTEAETRWQADSQLRGQIDAERQERETQDASLQNQLGSKLTVDNIKAGNNVTITKEGNNVTINSTGGGGPVPENIMTVDTDQMVTGQKSFDKDTLRLRTHDEESITLANYTPDLFYTKPDKTESFYGAVKYTEGVGYLYKDIMRLDEDRNIVHYAYPYISTYDIDNQTLKVQDGVLHADFSEIGDEVNTLAGRMNTVENELGDLTERVEELSLYKFPNAIIKGEPTINNGQISGFSTTNYLQFPFEFETKGRTWLLNGSFTTGNDITTQQNIIDSMASIALAVRSGRLVMALSTTGTSFDLGEHLSMSDIEANTTYYFRISFSGTQYLLSLSTDKTDYIPEAIVTSSTPIASRPMTISSPGHPFGNIINLNDWNLTVANTLVWQGMDDVGIASRMDVNALNITETGIKNLKEALGINGIEDLVDSINISYSNTSIPTTASVMMLSLEPNELDVEDSFTSNKSKAVFSNDLILPENSTESYDDDTDVDLGGNA